MIRRSGSLARSLFSALAVILAAAVPSIPSLASADPARDDGVKAGRQDAKATKASRDNDRREKVRAKDAEAERDLEEVRDEAGDAPADEVSETQASDDARKKAKGKTRERGKAHGKKGSKAHASKTGVAPAKSKKVKKTAARAAAKKKASKKARSQGDAKAPLERCSGPETAIDRNGQEQQVFALVDCHGEPREGALSRLSELARPYVAARTDVDEEGVAQDAEPELLDPGLLTRLDAIARRYAGRPISIVSGWQPQSKGSYHQTGKALDFRIAGVQNADIVAVCKTLPDTGCGYYPRGGFVHVDVRAPESGVVAWIDASSPGEPPRYVTSWPPKDTATVVPPADHDEIVPEE